MKRRLGKQIFKNTLIYTLYVFFLELIVKINAHNNIIEWSSLRIFLSSIILGLLISVIISLFNQKVGKIIGTIITFGLAFFAWVEINLFNYLGFFMGVGNAEQGTKIVDYIKDYIQASKVISYLVLAPFIIYLFYIWFLDGVLQKRKLSKTTVFVFKRETFINRFSSIIVSLCFLVLFFFLWYLSLDAKFMQNRLQSVKNTSLIKMSDNSNLSVSQFGLFTYSLSDLYIQIFNIESDDVIISSDPIEKTTVLTDNSRTIDDTAWKMVIENESNSTYNKLNNYFINRDITDKNDYTGIFEGKNLIIILMESVNMIAINEEEFPTLYKMYNEGIAFTNNYSPRNNCSTGNNEMTVMTSLFTINNTCTANKYKSNVYPEAVFNIFRNAGYTATSYHDYADHYYSRKTIHPNMGSQKYYNVIDLKIKWKSIYEEWPSDVDLIKAATPHFINDDHFMAFLVAVTTHQPYTVSSEYGDKNIGEFSEYNYSKAVKRYMSKMKELDKALELLLNTLEENGKLDDTVIALFGDHYPYGLSTRQINEVLDYDVTVNKEVDRTPLIIYNSATPALKVEKYTTIIDLLPTLLNMFNMDYDPRLYLGNDIMSDNHGIAIFADGSWQDEVGYYNSTSGKFKVKEGMEPYSNEELLKINNEINAKQNMSARAIKNNYFKYLDNKINKYKSLLEVVDSESEES